MFYNHQFLFTQIGVQVGCKVCASEAQTYFVLMP
jgi:hypothetical protein